ncbi:zinc ABC transporter ATP-binding protein ZnuC [Vibrio maritimus]|uniref:Zinc ABC transporter ATP-binding protein ZnuC n=1 Tax=Vibrio maritimus TaxID=990268 RepID=A0A090S2F4_9VIBR|nr:zinc ABC transporter ATP-binding protein ZnuC [Vibrio maritimus]
MVSHDLHLVMAKSDNVICLHHHICCQGTPRTVSQHPSYIALFGSATQETLASISINIYTIIMILQGNLYKVMPTNAHTMITDTRHD